MFSAAIRQQLGPLIERLAEIEAEIEDLRRRAENHNRIGIVAAVDPGALYGGGSAGYVDYPTLGESGATAS